MSSIVERRKVWAIALYRTESESSVLTLDREVPFRLIGERGFRRGGSYRSTVADPFLFAHGGRLFLFYEVQTDFGVGEIWAESMDQSGEWRTHGRVLKEPFHLSYPQVFSHNGSVWMVPEAAASGQVLLYRADAFPTGWSKVRWIIDEPLLDPSVITTEQGIYVLGTTRGYELKLYHSTVLDASFEDTGIVISRDKARSRNAGRPFRIGDSLFRPAQNCQVRYAQNVSLLKIDSLSPTEFHEETVVDELFQGPQPWRAEGYHHISTARFGGGCFVAVDGMRKDRYLNTVILAVQKTLGVGTWKM